MDVLITLSGVGSNAGPTFDLSISSDGVSFVVIESGIDKALLEPGLLAFVEDGTTEVKLTSLGQCTNSYVAIIGVIPTTTTTTTPPEPITPPYLNATDDWITNQDGTEYVSKQTTIINDSGEFYFLWVGVEQIAGLYNNPMAAGFTSQPAYEIDMYATATVGQYFNSYPSFVLGTTTLLTGTLWRDPTIDSNHIVQLWWSWTETGEKTRLYYQ